MEENVRLFFQRLICVIALIGSAPVAIGCINDSFVRALEGAASPDLKMAVEGKLSSGPTREEVTARLSELEKNPRQLDPRWWNDLAGAHIRLGNLERAVEILSPLVSRFRGDYGVHSNLGTALHLLGRYKEAEVHVAEGLRINPGAHNGLEVYHLALLQYLSAPMEWQKKHVYVDEWTNVFLHGRVDDGVDVRLVGGELIIKTRGDHPPYRREMVLSRGPKQTAGVAYMLSLNQTQPACFVMAGLLALEARDAELSKLAFTKAIELNSPQRDEIQKWIDHIAWIERESVPRTYQNFKLLSSFLLAIWLLSVVLRWAHRAIAS